jgi:hypothetical protein
MRSVKRAALITLRAVIFTAVVFAAVQQGLALRRWMYPATVPNRFNEDIDGAWEQGQRILQRARSLDPKAGRVSFANLMHSYLGRYAAVMKNNPDGNYGLDYPPARLFIMTVWVWHETDGGKPPPRPTYLFGIRIGGGEPRGQPAELAGPLLNVNTGFELAAMASAFMLAWAVLRRDKIKCAKLWALGPALLIWFNPAVLMDAHVWPQWDAWPLPFWLLAGYFAVTRRWLAAGLCLGLGTMFKGQIFLMMLFFVLWPLFQRRWRSVLNVTAGMLLGMMLGVLPWMLWTTAARVSVGIAIAITLAALPWIRRGWRWLTLCGIAGAALLLAGLFLGGDFAWWHVGFEYGAERWKSMTMGPAPNLAQTMGNDFGWQLTDILYTFTWKRPAIHLAITVQQALEVLYGMSLVLCAVAAARQDRRGDRHLLLAMATPWVVMFAFLPQMHDRYLVWGAAFTAMAAAVSVGSTLMHLVVTFIACLPMVMQMHLSPGKAGQYPNWFSFIAHANNETPFLTILVALIFLYLSLRGSPRPREPDPRHEHPLQRQTQP